MQVNKKQKGFKNYYYDSLMSFLYQHFSKQKIESLDEINITDEEDKLLCEYGAIKNAIAGVKEVNISCKNPANAINALDKYGLKGCAVVDDMVDLPEITSRVIVHIKDVLARTENELQDIAIKIGRTKVPVMITYGRSLKELGTIDKEYGLSPATFLESLGFLERKCMILGGNALEKDDLNLLATYDAVMVVSPQADMYLARGFINLSPLLSQGLEIAFASEAYPKVDMLAEVELGAGQTANLMHNGNIAKPEELVLKVLVEGGKGQVASGRLLHSVVEGEKTDISSVVMLRYLEIENKLIKKFKEKLWK